MNETEHESKALNKVHQEDWQIFAEIEDFEIACRAKLAEDGIKKEELIKEVIEEAVEHCSTIQDTSLKSIQIKNLQDGLRSNEDDMVVMDLVGFININSSKGIYKDSSPKAKSKFYSYYSITLSSAHSEIECLPILDNKIKEIIDGSRDMVKKWALRGFFVPLPRKGSTYHKYFYVIGVHQYEGTYKAYGFTKDELSYADKLIRANQDNMKNFLFKNLKTYLGIKKLKDNEDLKKCLEFSILQALSSNEINSKNGRLHSVIWGAPSSGKNFIIRAIELLNLEFREGQSGKMTTAGLLGACTTKNGRFTSEAGLLPLALYGTFAMQDFHSLDSNHKNNFFGITSKAMQDGVAIDSTAAKTSYLVQTSVHLDANKASDIKHKKDTEVDFDLEFGIPAHILTRFDLLMSMRTDPKLQFETSREMLKQNKKSCEIENPDNIFKLIIALLREEHPIITISDEVRAFAQKKLDELYKDNKLIFENNSEISKFHPRLSFSMIKILHSIARLNGRNCSILQDVNYMIRFLEPKISFLSNFDSKIQVASLLSKNEKIRKCQEFIINKFSEEPFTIKEVMRAMAVSSNLVISEDASERTVRRYILNIAHKTKHGSWVINKLLRRH
jgi:hypothetical protein